MDTLHISVIYIELCVCMSFQTRESAIGKIPSPNELILEVDG